MASLTCIDGDGAYLYLFVHSRRAKFWLFGYTRGDRLRVMGLGAAKARITASLSAARANTRQLHEAVGEVASDPLAERDVEVKKPRADAMKSELPPSPLRRR